MIKIQGTIEDLIRNLKGLHTPKDDILTMELYYEEEQND